MHARPYNARVCCSQNPLFDSGVNELPSGDEEKQQAKQLNGGSADVAEDELQRLMTALQGLTRSVASDAQTLNSISEVALQATRVLNSVMVSTMNSHQNEIFVETKNGKDAVPQLCLTSLRNGKGSVVVDEKRSGPNALALCANGKIEDGKDNHRDDKHGKHSTIKTPGRYTGTSFTPHDFSGPGNSEQLVVVVDGKEDVPHVVTISTNIQTVDDIAQLLHQQPWVRRPATQEDGKIAKEAATALASHLRDFDPVTDGGTEDYITPRCFGLFYKNSLPTPLQTNADIRLERRFSAALQVLNSEIKFRFSAIVNDNFAAATTMASRQIQQQAMLGTALGANQDMQNAAEEAFEATAEAVLDQVIGGG